MQKKEVKKRNKKKFVVGLILGLIPLIFLLYVILGPLLHIITRDLSAKEMYVVADWVNVRADANAKSLKMGKIYYGTNLLCYDVKDGWAEVLLDKHQVYIAEKFIADAKSFYYLDGLFGDKASSKKVANTKYRKALVRYLLSKKFSSNIPEDIRQEFADESIDGEIYQLFTEPAGSRFNSVVYADFDGDFRQDAAFVLSNKIKDLNRLVIISLDKDNPHKISRVIYDKELEHPWQYIRLAKKGHTYQKDSTTFKLPLNGLLVGSNRSKNLHDNKFLILYNGNDFDVFEQSE